MWFSRKITLLALLPDNTHIENSLNTHHMVLHPKVNPIHGIGRNYWCSKILGLGCYFHAATAIINVCIV